MKDFFNPYSHGFVRVAVATPRVRVADPDFNVEATVELMQRAAREKALLAVFPELGLSAYTCDDLFHQRALLDARRGGARRASLQASRDARRSSRSSACRCASTHLLFNCAAVIAAGRHPRRRAEDLPAELPRVLRGAPVHAGRRGALRPRSTWSASDVPFGTDLMFRRAEQPLLRACTSRSARTSGCRSRRRRYAALAGATVLRQPVGVEHHGRQGRLPAPAGRQPVGALPRGLPVLARPGWASRPPTWPGTARR